MVIVMKGNAPEAEISKIEGILKQYDLKLDISRGTECIVIGLVGDTSQISKNHFEANPYVENVIKIADPYKKSNRKFHPQDTIIDVGGREIGGKKFTIIAGPCSVETSEQILETANAVKSSGALFLRGGAFKPRTSPYAFQGLELHGLELLREAGTATDLPIVTEIMSSDFVGEYEEKVDIIQVGARNMQNFSLLKELGKTQKPILLKRGLANTVEELLMSAEYILAGGNPNVILCERGIRTFETSTRNTLDISAIPIIKRLSHLPVIVDPSHASGQAWLVPSLSKAAISAGADGLIIEVHNNPPEAKCDGAQSLNPEQFAELMVTLKKYTALEGREL
ncbi:MAG: 3-deoxy-7-phosphoheptulonate synthase [Clostridiales bacterium]|jgi:3-deoxy-7-phosphoheptulonate synthase|nr:3-deoxy-7-phosphoheptulonate synthase [Clostridiales bacterium]